MDNINIKDISHQENWIKQFADAITDPKELLKKLKLDKHISFNNAIKKYITFKLRVPKSFITRMKIGDPNDPLLRQVLITEEELKYVSGLSLDPLHERQCILPGLLHKYHNRVLLLLKSDCAIHCRYCFRRFFPYQQNQINRNNILKIIKYINQHVEINEVILSGGDPLMAKDHEIDCLINMLEEIQHLTILRIHSRLPVIIPARITTDLCQRFYNCRLKIILVTHINHANEIDQHVHESMKLLRNVNVTLLNQSVLLRKINDNANTLAELSKKLFSVGILPYYLHVPDYVQGTSHFIIDDHHARKVMKELLRTLSGYLIPRLVREIYGKQNKMHIDLKL